MSWVAVGIAAAGALYGGVQGQQEAIRRQKIEDKTRKANAAATAVSWARKDGKGNIPDIRWNELGSQAATFKGAMGGGMMGYQLGSGIDKGLQKTDTTTTNPVGGSDGTNALGGTDMASALGDQANSFQTSMQQTPMSQPQGMDWNQMANSAELKQPQFGSSWNQTKKPSLYGSF